MADKEFAKAIGRDLPISTKQSIEVCDFIRGKKVAIVKDKLGKVIGEKEAVPFKRHRRDVGHKKGRIAAGRYPRKTCTYILKLVASAEANAKNLGFNVSNLVIKSAIANKGSRPARHGRRRGIQMRRSHVEVIVAEVKK